MAKLPLFRSVQMWMWTHAHSAEFTSCRARSPAARLRGSACVMCAVLLAVVGVSGATSEQRTELISVSSTGAQGHMAVAPAISADGRFVAFGSAASNLVPDDTNGVGDVFVRDRQSGTTERVSVSSTGAQANDHSGPPFTNANVAISADGRYVAFASRASNLVSDDTYPFGDVFVRDRATQRTERVSIGPDGQDIGGGSTMVALSADGNSVAFDSVFCDAQCVFEVFVRDRSAGRTERVSVSSTGAQANSASAFPALSADGRFIAYASAATNLVEGDTNGLFDVFLSDRQSGTVELISVTNDGLQGNRHSGIGAVGNVFGLSLSISNDGRFVAFVSDASNLVAGDTNGFGDVFVRDRASGTTERVSIGSAGEQAAGSGASVSISADGRFVAFPAFGLPEGNAASDNVFLRDRETHTTELIDVGNIGSSSFAPAINADGRFVAFYSSSATLVSGDTNGERDVFVRDRGGVVDAEPPVLTVPADVIVDATSPAGATVTFVASALDNVDGALAATCAPASGSTFAVGTTTVGCSARDVAGNLGSATFTVTVRPFVAPFAAFAVKIEIQADEIELKALFTLGATSDGIQPMNEVVTLQAGAFAVTFPAGAFMPDGNGRVRVRAEAGGPGLDARIRPLDGGAFEFKVDLPRDHAALLGPGVEVSLTIGNDRGTAAAVVEID